MNQVCFRKALALQMLRYCAHEKIESESTINGADCRLSRRIHAHAKPWACHSDLGTNTSPSRKRGY